MKAEFRSGTAYITTYAGEWYFAYNDRPITLYHKNSIPVKGRNGDLIRHSHIQPVELYAPLQALAYIRNHEAAEERRLLGGLCRENLKLQNGTHKAEHVSQASDDQRNAPGRLQRTIAKPDIPARKADRNENAETNRAEHALSPFPA